MQLKGVKVGQGLVADGNGGDGGAPAMTTEVADNFARVCSVLMSRTASHDELLELSKTEQYDKASKLAAERIQIVTSQKIHSENYN